MKKILILIVICILLYPLLTFAIYKWVDENGVIHFTDYPPKNGNKKYVDLNFNKDLSELSDSFGDRLVGKDWIKANIDDPDSLIEKGDSLTLISPGDRDIWYNTFTAPVLYKKIRKVKDFQVEVKLSFKTNGSDKAGIVLWTDKRGKGDIVLLCKSKDEDINFRRIIGSESIKGTEPSYDKEEVILRLIRNGDKIKGEYSEDGSEWINLGEVDFPIEGPLNIGIFGCSWKPNPTKIKFDYFAVKEIK